MATCANGHEVSPSWAFCPTCGAPFGEPAAPSGPAAVLADSSGPQEAGTEPNVSPASGVADPRYPPPPDQRARYTPSYQQGGYPAPLPGTNGLAIVSLVLGILWIYGLGSILALIFGLVGRNQIHRSGGRQRGLGFAIAGIVLGTVGIIAAVLLTVLLGAAGNNRDRTSTASPSSVQSVAPTSATSPTSVTPLSVLRPPDGYQLLTGQGSQNGPITPSDFDNLWGDPVSTHFVHGYDVTYLSNTTGEAIESTLFTFASPADASGFERQIVGNVQAANLSPTMGSLTSIPRSVMLRGTKADSFGDYYIDVVALKGATVMVVEYSNDRPPTGVPDVLRTSASQQYAEL